MSNNKIFKNHQINIGMPFPVKAPITYQPPVRKVNLTVVNLDSDAEEAETEKIDYKAMSEEIVSKAREEADMIVKEALLDAKDILSQASVETAALREQALQAARQEGYEEGKASAEQEYARLLEEAEEIKNQAGIEYNQILASVEEDAVNTILEIAKKVISQELKCKENLFLMIRDAFDKCSRDRKATLKLSETDYNTATENQDELMQILQMPDNLEIKKDMTMEEGDCIIETPYGSIDAGAETKFENIESDLKSLLNQTI